MKRIYYLCGMSLTKRYYEQTLPQNEEELLDFDYQYQLWKEQIIEKYEQHLIEQAEQENEKQEEDGRN